MTNTSSTKESNSQHSKKCNKESQEPSEIQTIPMINDSYENNLKSQNTEHIVLNTISDCFEIDGFDITLSRHWYCKTMLEKQFIAKYLNEKNLLNLIIDSPAIWLLN